MGKAMKENEGLLHGLDDHLKREVDDLKALISSTLMDLGGSSNASRFAKVQNLLRKLKGDIHRRDMFEASSQLAETRAMHALERLATMMKSVGPQKIAE